MNGVSEGNFFTHHFIHEILNTHFVQYAVGIDEENEQVVVPLQVLGVNLVNELEGGLLAMSLSTMRKPRNCDARSPIGNINTFGIAFQGQRYSEFLDCLQVQLILLISIERKKDVKARRRIITVDNRVNCCHQDVRVFLVNWHHDDGLRR